MLRKEDRSIRLPLWSKAIGTFVRCFRDYHFVCLKINNTLLAFAKESKEAEVILKKLGQCPSGTKIGVLKSDIPENPYSSD